MTDLLNNEQNQTAQSLIKTIKSTTMPLVA
jgi:hypothetical protein